MSSVLPIGVILPTRNVMERLPRHLECVSRWAHEVAEILVVDSQSKDGTVEFIRSRLRQPNLRFYDHPPGLYQSWNFGIAQVKQPYTYLSTIGDAITSDELHYLYASAEQLGADAVVTPPRVLDERGRVVKSRWPAHDLIEDLGIREPRALSARATFMLAVLYGVGHLHGVLGNSASNIYRTSTLQKLPFPTDVGTVGDVFWGVRHGLDVTLGVAPKPCGSFLTHDKGEWGLKPEQVAGLQLKLRQESETLRCRLSPEDQQLLEQGMRVVDELEQVSTAFRARRKQGAFWFLDSQARAMLSRRNGLRKQLRELRIKIVG